MKLHLSDQDKKALNDLFLVDSCNSMVASIYNNYLLYNYNDINQTLVNKMMGLYHCDEKRAYYLSFLNVLGIQERDRDFKKLVIGYDFDSIDCLDAEEYKNNPYFKNIHCSKKVSGSWELSYNYFNAYEGFTYEDVKIQESFKEITKIGYFKEKFPYLCVQENNVVWMSITPHEINTMKEAISKAHGSIVVLGLGLGYFPYMCSLKKEVNEIVVLEKDPDVIQLFKDLILPQMEYKDKIVIKEVDAIDYFSTAKEIPYSFCFVDLWHDANDGITLYLKIKAQEKKWKDMEFSYWIEESLLCYIRRCVLVLMDELLNGSTEEQYKDASNESDMIINKIYLALKDTQIDSIEDIHNLLKSSTLKELAKNIY